MIVYKGNVIYIWGSIQEGLLGNYTVQITSELQIILSAILKRMILIILRYFLILGSCLIPSIIKHLMIQEKVESKARIKKERKKERKKEKINLFLISFRKTNIRLINK
jgi:hypothetical protein